MEVARYDACKELEGPVYNPALHTPSVMRRYGNYSTADQFLCAWEQRPRLW